MSARAVVIVGAGIAGTAAAWAASRDAEVTLIDGGVGATALSSGAVDLEPWDQLERAARLVDASPHARPLDGDARAFLDALTLFHLPERGPLPLLATTAGRVRSARGHDRALLDLRRVAGRRILLPRADRPGWDADSLARALAAETPAELALSFDAVDAVVLRFDDERRVGDAELAGRHDDEARLAWLGRELTRLAARKGGEVAALLGPWLGASAPRADALSASLGFPVGEALTGPPGPAGMRFEVARDRLFAERGVRVVRERALSVTREGAVLRVKLSDGPSLAASTVVLAIGGLVGGGIVFDPPEHGAPSAGAERARPPYRLSIDLAQTAPLSAVGGSLAGPVLDEIAWPRGDRAGSLERIGCHCIDDAIAPSVLVAGDALADRPRTILEALASGLRVGALAARPR